MKSKVKRISIAALILALLAPVSCLTAFAGEVLPYDDVSQSDWFYVDVMEATEKGIFEGVDGKFLPSKPLNRAEMAIILSRLTEAETTGKKGSEIYSDVPEGAWYDEAVGFISELGLAEGTGDGCFSPIRLLTREQFAVLMYNFSVLNGLEGENKGEALGFEDSVDISSWAADAMDWAVSAGVLRGSGSKLFPKRPMTRAEAAAALSRWIVLKTE